MVCSTAELEAKPTSAPIDVERYMVELAMATKEGSTHAVMAMKSAEAAMPVPNPLRRKC